MVVRPAMFRFSLGVTGMDRNRNEYIIGTQHVGCFGGEVKETGLRWFGGIMNLLVKGS